METMQDSLLNKEKRNIYLTSLNNNIDAINFTNGFIILNNKIP